MELWVRSQDREILLKVNELEIEENMIIAFDNSKYQCLGTYKTKERALKVLDEIEKFIFIEVNIVNAPYEAADIEVKSNILCNMVKIFEMPEE